VLKCSRCGEYYIPGYLDCRCRTTLYQSRQFGPVQPAQPSNNTFVVARPDGETKPTPVDIPSSGRPTTS
jgi:hypothetical protein